MRAPYQEAYLAMKIAHISISINLHMVGLTIILFAHAHPLVAPEAVVFVVVDDDELVLRLSRNVHDPRLPCFAHAP